MSYIILVGTRLYPFLTTCPVNLGYNELSLLALYGGWIFQTFSLIEFQGNLCSCLVSDDILGYSILTPCYLAGLTSWIWKLQGIIWKKTGREDMRPIYLLYFAFISGFNNHSVGVEILPEYKWNGCISQSRC